LAAFGATAAVAACNAITGIGSLEEEHTSFDAGFDVTPPPIVTSTGTVPPPPPPPEEAGVDALAGDARTDATIDAAPDTFVPPVCTPGSSGARYGVLAASTQTGSPNWGAENGARAPNDGNAAHTNGNGDGVPNPNTLTISHYGFAIPTGATINGIKLEASRTAIGTVSDKAVTLFKGTAKDNGAWPAGPPDGPYITTTYGGPTDLWGTTWTAEDINALAFSANMLTNGDGDGHIDAMGLTVYYCVTK